MMCLRTRISWDRGIIIVIRSFNLTKADYIYNEDCLAEGFEIRLEDPTVLMFIQIAPHYSISVRATLAVSRRFKSPLDSKLFIRAH
jgi:hypothetical protein